MTTKLLLSALVALTAFLAAASMPSASLTVRAGVIDEIAGYELGATLSATVDSFRSRRGLIPFNYYSIPLPKPDEHRLKDEKVKENLGRVLLGNREQPSLYNYTVGNNVSCTFLGSGSFAKKDMSRAIYLGENKYYGAIILDGLPALSSSVTSTGKGGTRLGYRFGSENSINNFLAFTVKYTRQESGKFLITGFSVEPKSFAAVSQCTATSFVPSNNEAAALQMQQSHEQYPVKIDFFYSVQWVEDPHGNYFSRMDVYEQRGLHRNRQRKGHWTTAVNAVLLMLLLGAAVAIVVARTVRRDLLQYADEELADDLHEETGWKLVRGDAFRPPKLPVLFACVIAAGCQLIMMVISVFFASTVGVLHPTQRGNLLTGLIMGFLLASFVAGYVGARMLKVFKRRSWANGLLTVVMFPICFAAGYLSLNVIHWMKHSASAIPFVTCLTLILSWFALSIPLGIAGVTFGFRAAALQPPTKVSTIPRLIPVEANSQVVYHCICGGFVPFSAAFIELVYVLASFWQGERFHMLGFLAIIGAIVAVLCGEVAIVVTYLALNHEDYRWWWRSFFSVASSGVYLYLYSIFYLFVYLELRLVSSIVLFLGYMAGVSTLFGLMCGTVGFLTASVFVRYIFTATKGD